MKTENLKLKESTRNNLVRNELFTHGKLPPQCCDLEEVVLGACLLEQDAYPKIASFLKAEAFYKEAHQIIYAGVTRLFDRNEPIDTMTLMQELKATNELEVAGGGFYLAQLTNRIASSANIEFHARIILEKFISREGIRICSNAIQKLYEDDSPFEPLSEQMNELNYLQNNLAKRKAVHMSELGKQAIENDAKGNKMGLPTGFKALDEMIFGFNEPDFIILAARPAQGKTAKMLKSALTLGRAGIPCAINSLEMSAMQLYDRLVCMEGQIDYRRMRLGELYPHEIELLKQARKRVDAMPIYIDDQGGVTVNEIKAKAVVLKNNYGIRMLFIDYIQLMEGVGNSREQEISSISRGLKALCKELHMPIMALSQLNRAVEGRTDKRPNLADLRESGSLEQDADIVIFLMRPDYYNKDYDEQGRKKPLVDKEGNIIPENYAQSEVAKHRNGATGLIPLNFKASTMTFSDWETEVITNSQPF